MTLEFIKQINEYVIEATMEASDEAILCSIGETGCPTWDDIRAARLEIDQAVKKQRKYRLEQKRSEFIESKNKQPLTLKSVGAKKSISTMLTDIVQAMQNKDNVPEGLLIAFRKEGQSGSEDDIKKIWLSFVELGLIDPSDEG